MYLHQRITQHFYNNIVAVVEMEKGGSHADSGLCKLFRRTLWTHPLSLLCVHTNERRPYKKNKTNKKIVYSTKHHPFKKVSEKITGQIIEPFANIIVRQSHQ